ncbi:10766_t:CDS:2, partial [Cetraspora pellucida]
SKFEKENEFEENEIENESEFEDESEFEEENEFEKESECEEEEKRIHIPKMTYYHKYGASGIFANDAKGITKITSFFESLIPLASTSFSGIVDKSSRCQYKEYKKGMYIDSYEREDIITYQREFLENMKLLERCIVKYEGEQMVPILPVLEVNEQKLILVTHDKYIFYMNDGKRNVWNERSIMVSEFLLETCGWLQLSEEEINAYPDIPMEAHYKAIPIFETKFPNAITIFAFDNSTSHVGYAKDALLAERINLGPGRKQLVM